MHVKFDLIFGPDFFLQIFVLHAYHVLFLWTLTNVIFGNTSSKHNGFGRLDMELDKNEFAASFVTEDCNLYIHIHTYIYYAPVRKVPR